MDTEYQTLLNKIKWENFDAMWIRCDQPTTCPKCGIRTEIIFDMGHTINETQIHECLSPICGNTFVVVSDVETIIWV